MTAAAVLLGVALAAAIHAALEWQADYVRARAGLLRAGFSLENLRRHREIIRRATIGAGLILLAVLFFWKIGLFFAVLAAILAVEVRRRARDKRRRWRQFRDFPLFLDLTALLLSAGASVREAFLRSVGYLPEGELRRRLERTRRLLQTGAPFVTAVERLSVELDDLRLRPALLLLKQGAMRGAPLYEPLGEEAQALRSLAHDAREAQAQSAPLRILAPIALFIFPAVFLVVFAPLIVQFLETGSLF